MSVIHIKRQRQERPDGTMTEVFAVPAMAISTSQGKKLIPNPAGVEVSVFENFELAEEAVRRAGFDYIFEGRTTYTQLARSTPLSSAPVNPTALLLKQSIQLLLDRLKDREPASVANAVFALGELNATEALQPFSRLLGHEDSTVRRNVSEAMAKLGEASLEILYQAYREAKRSLDPNARQIRLTVVNAYLEMAQTRRHQLLEKIMDQLVEALEDESWLVRSQAALVLGHSASFFLQDTPRE